MTPLECLLPVLKARYVFMFDAYFDESGTHAQSPLVCVAGYLFEREQCILFDREWSDVLAGAGITRFHMSECAHGAGEFKRLPPETRRQLATQCIGIIRRRMTLGIAASVRKEDYVKISNRDPQGAYLMALLWCVYGVASWARKNNYAGNVGYYFEAGHALQAKANEAMMYVHSRESLRNECRYSGHAFIAKETATPVQAADLLAWHWHKDWMNRNGEPRRPRRMDFDALTRSPHVVSHLTIENLRAIASMGGLGER